MLAGWLPDLDTTRLTLNTALTSLGIFLPIGARPSLLIIAPSDGSRVKAEWLEILASDDNEKYFPLNIKGSSKPLQLFDSEILAIKLPQIDQRYLKLRFTGVDRHTEISGSARDLVQLYGEAE